MTSRSEFDRKLHDSLVGARDGNEQVALLIVVVDDLGSLLGRLGDAAAARVRRWIADKIASILKADDVCARYGADGFAILCLRTSAQEAGALAHRIRTRVSQSPCDIPEAADAYFFTVSVGVAHATRTQASDAAGFADEAARAAGAAKAVGGNRVHEGG